MIKNKKQFDTCDKHNLLTKYPTLIEAICIFDGLDCNTQHEQRLTDKRGTIPNQHDIKKLFSVLEIFLGKHMPPENTAILSFVLELVNDQICNGDYFYIDPALDGLEKFIKRFLEDEDIIVACEHIVDHVRSSTLE